MTTKDYVDLGLILLTALAFYCNGFYAGVYRCKRIYDKLIGEAVWQEYLREVKYQLEETKQK